MRARLLRGGESLRCEGPGLWDGLGTRSWDTSCFDGFGKGIGRGTSCPSTVLTPGLSSAHP